MIRRPLMKRLGLCLVTVLLLSAPIFAQQPPPKTPPPASDGFVPVDAPINPQDTMPAPRLVAIAYGFIWVALFGYVWSVGSRLTQVQREIEAVNRRVSSGKK